MPGEFPSAGYENPYRASSLDPRVDGGKARPPGEATSSSSQGHNQRDLAGNTGPAGFERGVAGTGASQAFGRDGSSGTHHGASESAPSTLTGTEDPTSRSLEYGQSTSTRGLDSATMPTIGDDTSTQPHTTGATSTEPHHSAFTGTEPHSTGTAGTESRHDEDQGMMSKALGAVGLGGTGATSTEPHHTGHTGTEPHSTGTTGTEPHHDDQDQGMMSKVLGAVGLGGAGAAASSALGYGDKTQEQDEPRDTSAIASQPGQVSQETGPPTHYRRESIPTTAYPAGLNSPRAVAPPVGGAGSPATHTDHRDNHHDRDTGLGAGLGGGAIAASQLNDSQGHRDDMTRGPSSSTYPTSGPGMGMGIGGSGEPRSQHSDSDGLRESIAGPQTSSTTQPQTRSTIHDLITSDTPQSDSHTGRDVGLAATAVAAGAGAYGLHEHNKDSATSSTMQPSTMTGSSALPDEYRGLGSSSTTQPSTAVGSSVLPDRSRDFDTSSHAQPSVATGSNVLPDRSRDLGTPSTMHPSTATGSAVMPDRSRDVPSHAVAAAPGRYHVEDAPAYPVSSASAPTYEHERPREEDHTARNAALGAGAGAAAGGAAYAAYDHSRDEEAARRAAAEREQQRVASEREKDLAKQREAQEKAAAKERKEHEKEVERQHKHEMKEHEREEHARQKELERQHKHELKEREKEEHARQREQEKLREHEQRQHEKDEKERAAAAAAAEKRERARLASEEEDRMRREREAQAGIAAGSFGTAGAVAGTGMFGHEKDRRASAVGPTGEAAGVGQRGSYDNIYERDRMSAAHEHPYSPRESKHSHEKHSHDEKEKKPGFFKRIFKRRKNKDTGEDEDYSTDEEDHGHYGTAGAAGVGAGTGAATGHSHVPTHHSDTKGRNVLGSSPAHAGRTSTEHYDPTTGLPYDPAKDPEAARRLSRESPTSAGAGHSTYTIGRGTDSAPSGMGPTSGVTDNDGLGNASGAHGVSGNEHGLPHNATEPFGVFGEHHRP